MHPFVINSAMFCNKLANKLFKHVSSSRTLKNGVHVKATLIGAASEMGQNIAILMRQNYKLSQLNLYDDSPIVKGVGTELRCIPGGPLVYTFTGEHELPFSILKSDVIIMVARSHRHPGQSRKQLLQVNAPAVLQLCMAVARYNRNALVGIATNPVNCIIPFTCKVLHQLGYNDPFKILGVTQIDVDRTLTYASQLLNVESSILEVPVIGGHSEQTILPLFSNTKPKYLCVAPETAEALTKVIQKAGSDVVTQKQGVESSTIAMAWAVNTFADQLIDAVLGEEVIVNALTANPHYNTRYFSGPTKVNANGVVGPARSYQMSDEEIFALSQIVQNLNNDVDEGESHVKAVEDRIKSEYFSKC